MISTGRYNGRVIYSIGRSERQEIFADLVMGRNSGIITATFLDSSLGLRSVGESEQSEGSQKRLSPY